MEPQQYLNSLKTQLSQIERDIELHKDRFTRLKDLIELLESNAGALEAVIKVKGLNYL